MLEGFMGIIVHAVAWIKVSSPPCRPRLSLSGLTPCLSELSS